MQTKAEDKSKQSTKQTETERTECRQRQKKIPEKAAQKIFTPWQFRLWKQ
jgi:hypothetical protein